MKLYLTLLCCSIFFISNAQIHYEKGYIINEDGIRQKVFIKNIEWRNSPENLRYKLSETGDEFVTDISTVKEFGIDKGVVYLRATVLIDVSSSNVNDLNDSKNPIFKKEEVFLKKMVDGAASLYYYAGKGVERFFYGTTPLEIEPLVYKKFLTKEGKIGTNRSYRQELSNNLVCNDLTVEDFKELEYETSDLVQLFIHYNECRESKYEVFKQTSERFNSEDKFKLRVKAGIRSNKFSFTSNRTEGEFPDQIGLQFGLEGEYFFNFNRNKWSGLAKATYFSYEDDLTIIQRDLTREFGINYSAVEVGLGMRHSFFSGNNSRLFLNIFYVVPFNMEQSFTRRFNSDFEKFTTLSNFSFGAGFEYNRFSIDVEYQLPRTLINGLKSQYSNISATFGYSFL